MAYMVPETLPSRATAGERRLYETLRMHLPEDYIVYYEPEIDGRRSGVVAIGPDLGLVALLVKDYTSRSIHSVDGDTDEWVIWGANGETAPEPNPVQGARDEARRIAAALKRDRTLTEGNGAGLKVAVGYGVVFPRMSLTELRRAGLDELVDPAFVFCRDEIDAEADDFAPEMLFDKLQGMFPARRLRRRALSREELRAVRTHLFAEPRVGAALPVLSEPQDQLLLSAHAIDAPDQGQPQEQLARTLGDRHRLIRGATGSGKTLVLAHRARVLAKMHPEWRILVLCSGMALSGTLRRTIDRMLEEPEDLFDFPADPNDRRSYGIEVYNFREWLRGELRMKEENVPALLSALARGEAILPSYDAILIDEGQDFEPAWLRLVSSCLNPRTKSLLLVEDRALSMFRRKSSLARDTGLDFRGRSKVLSLSYRNTEQIVRFAWDFFQAFSPTGDAVRHGSIAGTELIPPQAAKRRGPEPSVRRFAHLREEMGFVAETIQALHVKLNIPYAEIAILYRVKNSHSQPYIDDIRDGLKRSSLPYAWLSEDAEGERESDGAEDAVSILSIDGAKGLDFRAVFLVNVESMPFVLEEAEEREVSRLYAGMTRALEWLFLTYSGESKYTAYLEKASERSRSLPEERHRSG
jgi:hypothetical protein